MTIKLIQNLIEKVKNFTLTCGLSAHGVYGFLKKNKTEILIFVREQNRGVKVK